MRSYTRTPTLVLLNAALLLKGASQVDEAFKKICGAKIALITGFLSRLCVASVGTSRCSASLQGCAAQLKIVVKRPV